ncbi:zinc-binding dehydrogenase [Paraphoma chrysanthemicola]|nr:zinc-binding dehydrogenase [Paraphoma chrysanthemicola]
MSKTYPALVAYKPNPKPNWKVETVKIVRSPNEKELKIRMVATGICHTDIVLAGISGLPGLEFPEFSATKEQASECELCDNHQEPSCLKWNELNISSVPGVFENERGGTVGAEFFQQSSFAGASIVNEGAVVNVKDLLRDPEELKLLAPLGCGFLTGSGAILNVARPTTNDVIMVLGMGGVGLAALMTAHMLGCKTIIAVDRVASRLDMAKELGATILLNTNVAGYDLTAEARRAVGERRITHVIDTTAHPAVIAAALAALGKRGCFIQLGAPRLDAELKIAFSEFFTNGKTFENVYLGNTTGQEHIPKMIQWYHEGKFPIDKLVRYFPAKDALQGLHGMESGMAIKPIVVW